MLGRREDLSLRLKLKLPVTKQLLGGCRIMGDLGIAL